jgi:hypothetical protein
VHSNPFSQHGRFFRGNLHTHSNRSDGARRPGEVVADYRARGYDFVSLTDHFLPASRFRPDDPEFITISDTRPFECEEFVTVLGTEIHGPAMENGEIWHFVAVGLPVDFAPWTDGETGPELAVRAATAGAFVGLAHPYSNAVSEVDALSVAGMIHSVEIYNHASEVGVRRGYGLHQAEVMAAKGAQGQLLRRGRCPFQAPTRNIPRRVRGLGAGEGGVSGRFVAPDGAQGGSILQLDGTRAA